MRRACRIALALLIALGAFAANAAAQTGTIEFTARVMPAAGRSEPVRELPFYLLRKSFTDIRKEADDAEPKPDMDAFIDTLDLSPELKAWMKRTHRASLSGDDFGKFVKVDDVMNVPEFWTAYLERNVGSRAVDFPQPKYHASDREKNPEKYEKLKAEYHAAVRKYLTVNPQSIVDLDISLMDIDPRLKWEQLEGQRAPSIRRRTYSMAESQYLAGRAETDMEGNGIFRNVAPGEYWLSTLEIDATIGDIRLRWDTPVSVRAGQTTRVELTNINAVEPHRNAR